MKNVLSRMNSFVRCDDQSSTADFQFVNQGLDRLHLRVNHTCCVRFAAFYKYDNNFYKHPYILHTSSNDEPSFRFTENMLYV